jgi:hypothetical protein
MKLNIFIKEKFLNIKRTIIKCYLNLFVAKKDEYYDYEEPSESKMKNKNYWIQIVE